ncbi:MAG: hypothetical protein AAB343_00160 [Patescibacteria group bacterium]
MLEGRDSKILFALIDAYIHSAAPVPSSYLSRKFRGALSPATIRNHFIRLTDEGFLEQPHTSSGRIPTEKAVRTYVDALFDSYQEQIEDQRILTHVMAERMRERIAEKYQVLAGTVSEDRSMKLSGFEQLFQSPEMRNEETLRHVGYVLDHFMSGYGALLERFEGRPITVFIGSDLAGARTTGMSMVVAPIEPRGALFIAGPMRMPYQTIIEELFHI